MRDNRLKPGVDIVLDVLKAVSKAYPDNQFAQSILYQYQERGGLSKKQLQGLYGKARKIKDLPPAKLATLEAIILKKPTKEKSPPPKILESLDEKNEATGNLLNKILAKYPGHKRVLYLLAKYESDKLLSVAENAELQRFEKTLF